MSKERNFRNTEFNSANFELSNIIDQRELFIQIKHDGGLVTNIKVYGD